MLYSESMMTQNRQNARIWRFEELRERENEFVRDCQQGDADAWEKLVARHSRQVYAMCRRFTGRSSESHDLTQEVFLRVFRNLKSFRASELSFGGWLGLVTRNLLIDKYRCGRMERASVPLEFVRNSERIITTDHPGRCYERAEASRKLHTALTALPVRLREAVILCDLDGLSYIETAGRLGVPVGTVKSRLNRGRQFLARTLRTRGIAA